MKSFIRSLIQYLCICLACSALSAYIVVPFITFLCVLAGIGGAASILSFVAVFALCWQFAPVLMVGINFVLNSVEDFFSKLCVKTTDGECRA